MIQVTLPCAKLGQSGVDLFGYHLFFLFRYRTSLSRNF
jgi:hypothetical protein